MRLSLPASWMALAVCPLSSWAQDGATEYFPYGERGGDAYIHPLLVAEMPEASTGSMTDEAARALLRDLVIYNEGYHDDSGAFVVRSVVRVAEREPAEEVAAPERAAPSDGPVIESMFADVVAKPDTFASEAFDVWLTFDVPEMDPVVALVDIEMLKGTIRTEADAWEARQAAVVWRRENARASLEPIIEDLEAAGALVLEDLPEAGLVRVDVPARVLAEVSGWEGLLAVERVRTDADLDAGGAGAGWDVYGPGIDGYELTDLLQLDQFYDDGYFGRPTERITLAELQGDYVYRAHVGFGGRFANCPGTGATCSSNPNPSVGDQHATAVASMLLGDLTTPGPCGGVWCEQRSGVAREALGYGVSSSEPWSHVQAIATGNSYVMTQSMSYSEDCSGATPRTRAWNSMYEDGVAIFMSDNNNGHDVAGDCTMGELAAAMGVFTVGAYDVGGTNPAAQVVRPSASRGGTASEGIRTMRGALAPNQFLYAYNSDSGAGDPYYIGWPDDFAASSAATPVAAGSAAVFRDWYRANVGTLIDDPGILYATTLLMGDRRKARAGAKLTIGFDNVWGAGLIRMRKLDGEGLDAPAIWGVGSTCVGNGQSVVAHTPPILSADVDYVKAVAWWYDQRHDNVGKGNGNFDRVSMQVQRDMVPSLGAWSTVATSAEPDNKQRIFYENPGGQRLRLRFSGTNVTQDAGGCGTNSVRVYWAWLLEENDRDDDAYLGQHIRPE